MSFKRITGTIGFAPDLNASIVNFSLLVNEDTHQVSGSVEIQVNPPEEKPYSGTVTGTAYATGYGDYVEVIAIQGTIPSNNKLTPIEFPFNAHMALKADGSGIGGFNFQTTHLEDQPVSTKS